MDTVGVAAARSPQAAAAQRRVPFPPVRLGALALLAGGTLSLVLHVLWKIGHGPTVVNEHGVALGLANDQWSHLGAPVVALLLAVGVHAVAALHPGRLCTVATAAGPRRPGPERGRRLDLGPLLAGSAHPVRRAHLLGGDDPAGPLAATLVRGRPADRLVRGDGLDRAGSGLARTVADQLIGCRRDRRWQHRLREERSP